MRYVLIAILFSSCADNWSHESYIWNKEGCAKAVRWHTHWCTCESPRVTKFNADGTCTIDRYRSERIKCDRADFKIKNRCKKYLKKD